MQNPSCLKGTFNTLAWKTIWSLLFSFCIWNSWVMPASAAINTENLLGRYELDSPTNDWHKGSLTWHPAEPGKLRWTNDAGVYWTLTPDVANGVLITGADYPYAQTAPNVTMQFLGVIGDSAVSSLQINGEAYSRRFTIRNAWPNTTANSNHMTRGAFIVWWEFGKDYAAHATDMLRDLERVRNECWSFGMRDPSGPRAGYYTNIYLTDGTPGAFGWHVGNGGGDDSNGYSYLTIYGNYNYVSNHDHEGFHMFQLNTNSPGFGSYGDSYWFLETSAVWYQSIQDPGFPFVMSGIIAANPHLQLWRSYPNTNPAAGDISNSNQEGYPYAMGAFLHYLTAVKGLPRSVITSGFSAGTNQSPQEYLYNLLGPANFRDLFREWSAHTAANYDYFSPAIVAGGKQWLVENGDPNDIHPYVLSYTDSGTGGSWVSPPSNLVPRSWASNVIKITNTAAASYTLQLNANATGTEGAASVFTGTAVVMDPSGNQFIPFSMSNNTSGTVTVNAPSTATQVFFVINSLPQHWSGTQNYPYQVKIDRNTLTTPLILAGSTWKYSATGTVAPADWAQPGFSDAAWPSGSGMLGLSINGLTPATTITNTTAITTYYCHSFTVADPSYLRNLTLKLLRDDGAVVWLNGVELHRSNMPAGIITSATPALTAISGAAEAVIHTSHHASAANSLVAGTNVIAVELHQANSTTGDLGFDLSLDAEFEIPTYYSYGNQTTPFTITATGQTRALGDNLGTFYDSIGSIYWRGAASDATYMHFDLSSLAGGTISGNVSLNQTVSAQHGGNITNGQLSTAKGAWTGAGATPGFTTIAGSPLVNGNFATNDIATWTLTDATFQGFVNSPATFHGLVLSGASGSQAHFSGAPTLTGTVNIGQIMISGASDWRAASFDAGSSTLFVSGSNDVIGGNVVVKSGATLSVVGAATLDSGAFAGTFANNGTLSFGSSVDQTLNGAISGNGALVKSGSGTLTLGAHNTYTGPTIINQGILEIGGGSLGGGNYAGAISIASGAILQINNGSQDLAGDISGDGGITHNGGHLGLTGNNTYRGVTTINSGRLFMGSLSPNTSFVINGAAQLYGGWNLQGATFINNMTLSGMGFVEGGVVTGLIRASNGQTFSGDITLAGDSRIGMTEGDNTISTYSGKITGNHALDLQGSIYESNRTITMTLANTGDANDFTGNTSISTAEMFGPRSGIKTVLRLGADNQIPNGTGKGNLVFNGANADHQTIFELNGYNETINGLSNAAADGAIIRNTAAGASILTIGDADTTSSFSGTITDGGAGYSLALAKTGTGTLTLTGPNTYIGDTTILNGTLSLSQASLNDNSSVSIATGATLHLNHTEDDIIDKLFLGGVHVVAGIWGRVGSIAAFGADFETPLITGDGMIVAYTGPDILGNWLHDNITAIDPGADATPGGDPDGDGLNNVGEFALDGNPLSGKSSAKTAGKVATLSGQSMLTLTIPVRVGAVFTTPGSPANLELVSAPIDGVVYRIQGSDTTLGDWTLGVTEVTGAEVNLLQQALPALRGPEWEYRTFRTPGTTATDPVDFIRATITTTTP